jgi:hypothetical protein
MAIDIRNLKPTVTTTIKHGTITVGHGCKALDAMKHYSPDHVKNTPVIADIDDKYDAKFDDPTYYN